MTDYYVWDERSWWSRNRWWRVPVVLALTITLTTCAMFWLAGIDRRCSKRQADGSTA